MIVDLVPPHMPSNKDEILGGYGYGHDLMTRAAIATGLDPSFEVKLPKGIETSGGKMRCKANGTTTCRIKVAKCLSGFLAIPNMKKKLPKPARSRRACLGDFEAEEDVAFELVVPYCMLRAHDETGTVRSFMGAANKRDPKVSQGGMTRPSIPKQSCIAETIVDTEDNDDDEEAIRESDPVVDLVGGQPGAQGLAELGEDAGAVPTIESLNAIAEAEQLADNATGNGNMDLLECEHLSSLERSVPIRYSVILGDGFHLLDRMWVPMHHEFKKSF
jgi:hypothetical protein